MNEDINQLDMERNLNGILNPVAPSNDFIEKLQNRLKSKVDVVVEYPNYLLPIIIIMSGLLFGAILLWLLEKILKIFSGPKKD